MPVFTKPTDLDDDVLIDALRSRWALDVVTLEYRAVGFGSHHWLATDAGGRRRFLTVDDLDMSRTATLEGTNDATCERLRRAYRTAHALRHEAGLLFVVAPLPGLDGDVLVRLDDRYSLIVQPEVEGTPAGGEEFDAPADRLRVVELVARLHAATVVAMPHGGREVGFLPGHDELRLDLERVARPWTAGPYGEQARVLLAEHASAVERLLDRCVSSADLVRDPDTMVITHGEPSAWNTMVTAGGLVLVDWESALLAPPERDIWDLDAGDGSVVAAYEALTGTAIVPERIDWYRLWYDLFEIAGYIDLFRHEHADTADAAESWKNLVHFLRPAERWPKLVS